MNAVFPVLSKRGTGIAGAIDRAVLGEWCDGDSAAIDALLAVFRDSALAEHTRLVNALACDDLTAFAKAAHRLRGVALSMGAHDLAEAAATLDKAARALDRTGCVDAMPVLETRMSVMEAEVPT